MSLLGPRPIIDSITLGLVNEYAEEFEAYKTVGVWRAVGLETQRSPNVP